MRIDLSELALRVPYPVFIPIGLPQGLRIDPEKGVVAAGVVTCGGKRVVVDPLSYTLWLTMQLGLSEKQLKNRFRTQLGALDFDVSLKTLEGRRLVHRLASYTDLEFFKRVRAVPKAMGVGSLDKEHPLRYVVKPNFGDKEVILNPLDFSIWTMWDGKNTLMGSWKEASELFKVKLPEIIPRQVGLVIVLLGQGLLSVDYA